MGSTSLEQQYRRAIISGAIASFDVNVTKDEIESEVILDLGGKEIDMLALLGLEKNCTFTEFVKRWCERISLEQLEKPRPLINYKKFRERLIALFEAGKYNRGTEYWTTKEIGEELYLRESIILTKDDESGDIKALVILRDFTTSRIREEEEKKRELERNAYIDQLTGGDNYIKFKENLHDQGTPGYIVSMDLRAFRIINSVCGIQKSNGILRIIHETLKAMLDKNDFIGHINADHFVFFLSNLNEISEENADKLRRTIGRITDSLSFISIDFDIPQLVPYFGIAFWTPDEKVEFAYSKTVTAKHKVKESRDKNYAFFSQDDTERLSHEKSIEEAFKDAISNNLFEIWYQPKYNPETTTLVGAEALVRWKKNGSEYTMPGEFIPLFERNGMIKILDEYVFRAVCEQQKKWLDEKIDIVPVSINLSRGSLYYRNIASQYKYIAEKIGIDPNYVPLEITESATVDNIDIKSIAESFHKEGFPLQMDDFGTGYSSLASLNTMHFDTLKLDKSLIDYIGNYSGDRLLEHTIALAKELGMHVTAEGVENMQQVEFLQNLRCDSIQGFYYSKPLSAENFKKSLLVSCVIESFEKIKSIEYYIKRFKTPGESSSLYELIVNITKNKLINVKGAQMWREEIKSPALGKEDISYTEEYEYVMKNVISPEYRDAYRAFVDRNSLLNSSFGKNEIRSFEYERMRNGKKAKMRMTMHLFKMHTSDDLWSYICVSDRTIQKKNILAPLNFTDMDSLTKIFSRSYAFELISYEVEEARKEGKKRILMLADIDDFKKCNASFGYKFGDEILEETAHRIKDFFKKSITARVGSDKFMILLDEEESDSKPIKMLTEEFKKRIGRTFYKNGETVKITVTVAARYVPDEKKSIEAILSDLNLSTFAR